MATANWSNVSIENTNFARLCKLLVDGGTRALRKVFDSIHPPHLLQSHLLDPKNHGILRNLLSKKILFKEQWDKLYPSGSSTVDSQGFDITLLCLLLRSICHLKTPTAGWKDFPSPTDTSTEDDVVRIKLYRNELYGHIEEATISDAGFNGYWNEIGSALVRLGGSGFQEEIDKLRVASMSPLDEKYFIHCLDEWSKNDEKVMEKLDTVMNKMNELGVKVDDAKQELKKVTGMLQTASFGYNKELRKSQDADLYSQNLKSTMEAQLEKHQEFVNSPIMEKMKIQDIFTDLTMHLQPSQLGDDKYTEINEASLFFPKAGGKEHPKSILIKGNPGMGKSLCCRNLVHKWAGNALSIPGIKFAFLLTFRQLNMLADKELNLRELLNLCSMLDESVMLDESMMEFIIHHPDQLLIAFDGYDEYKQCERHKMVSDFESGYPNDPKEKMPVAALISKLLKKKILRNSLVVATCRPVEASELINIHFDRCVEITGFAEKQVVEYVEKYFSSKKEVQAKALSNIQHNKGYLNFGRVPLMCMLMCVYMEFYLEESKEYFPKSLTDFYSKVILCIETKCNKAILKASLDKTRTTLAVQRNLDKLSELAAQSIVHEKCGFDEEDLSKLDLSDEGLVYLKSSTLLSCEATVRKSPFSEILHVYNFCHATIQEHFAARHFVRTNHLPAQIPQSLTFFEFMAGLVGLMVPKSKYEEVMTKLMEAIRTYFPSTHHRLVSLFDQIEISIKCLYLYGNKEFAKGIVKKNEQNIFSDKNGWIVLYNINIDYKVVSMLVDIFTVLNQEKSLPSNSRTPYYIIIQNFWNRPPLSIESLFTSLSRDYCTITVLKLSFCDIDDQCLKSFCKYLPKTKITSLDLRGNSITFDGAKFIVPYCEKLAYISLESNYAIKDKNTVCKLFKSKYPGLQIDI